MRIKLYLATFILSLTFNQQCNHQQQSTLTNLNNHNVYDGGTFPIDLIQETDAATELEPLPPIQPLPTLPITDAGTGPNGELIAGLRIGDKALFSGVLFNVPAVAYIETEYQSVQQRCMIDRRRETQEIIARYQAQVDRLNVSIHSLITEHNIIVANKNRDLNELNNIITQQRDRLNGNGIIQSLLWFGGGTIIGAIGTGAFVLLTR